MVAAAFCFFCVQGAAEAAAAAVAMRAAAEQ
jgi:hypothetical protein